MARACPWANLYQGRDELTDLTRTLGTLAGHASALELKLSQFIQQGTSIQPALAK
jgi:hypothetical protein